MLATVSAPIQNSIPIVKAGIAEIQDLKSGRKIIIKPVSINSQPLASLFRQAITVNIIRMTQKLDGRLREVNSEILSECSKNTRLSNLCK